MAEFSLAKVLAFPTTGIVPNRWYARLAGGAAQIRIANSSGVLIPLNYVSVTGDETITGQKTFNSDLIVGNPSLDHLRWDNVSKSFGIFSQAQFIHKYRGGAAGALNIGQFDVSGNASINNTSNAGLLLGTNNTTRIEIEADGDVLLKKVDNGVGDFVRIDPTTGKLTKGTVEQVRAEVGGSNKFMHEVTGTHIPLNDLQNPVLALTQGSNIFTPSEMTDGARYRVSVGAWDGANAGSGSERKTYSLTFESDLANVLSRGLASSNANYQSVEFEVNFEYLISFSGEVAGTRTVTIRLISANGFAPGAVFRASSNFYYTTFTIDTSINQNLQLYFRSVWSGGLLSGGNNGTIIQYVRCHKIT
jgi:hypothetical protein